MRPPPPALQPHDRVRAVREHSTGLPEVPALPGMFTPHPSHASSMRPDDQAMFPTTSVPAMTMHSRHTAGRLRAAASGQGMVVVVGLT